MRFVDACANALSESWAANSERLQPLQTDLWTIVTASAVTAVGGCWRLSDCCPAQAVIADERMPSRGVRGLFRKPTYPHL